MTDWHKKKKKTDSDFGSLWLRADKTINRFNPPPAYSPESHWPGPPCVTLQRETETQWDRKWDKETDAGKDWQMEAYGGTREAEESLWHWSFPFLSDFPHQQVTRVRHLIAVRSQCGVSGAKPMLMSPIRSQEYNDVSKTRIAGEDKEDDKGRDREGVDSVTTVIKSRTMILTAIMDTQMLFFN